MASNINGATNLLLRDKDGMPLPLHLVTLIGRDEECHIVLTDSKVSRYHTKLTVKNASTVLVEDLNSSNGTFVNDQRVRAPRTMTIGDELRLHEVRLRLISAESSNVDATVLASVNERTNASAANPQSQPQAAAAVKADAPANESDATYLLSADDLARMRELPRHAINVQRPAEVVIGPCLVVLSAPIRGKIIPLQHQGIIGQWTIGRNKDADLELIDRTVSREHARIRKQGPRWQIENIQAANKVYVNGEQVEIAELKSGDRILLGRTEIEFKLSHDSAAELSAVTTQPFPLKTVLFIVVGALVVATAGALFLIFGMR